MKYYKLKANCPIFSYSPLNLSLKKGFYFTTALGVKLPKDIKARIKGGHLIEISAEAAEADNLTETKWDLSAPDETLKSEVNETPVSYTEDQLAEKKISELRAIYSKVLGSKASKSLDKDDLILAILEATAS